MADGTASGTYPVTALLLAVLKLWLLLLEPESVTKNMHHWYSKFPLKCFLCNVLIIKHQKTNVHLHEGRDSDMLTQAKIEFIYFSYTSVTFSVGLHT
jgi:hypothetical protein